MTLLRTINLEMLHRTSPDSTEYAAASEMAIDMLAEVGYAPEELDQAGDAIENIVQTLLMEAILRAPRLLEETGRASYTTAPWSERGPRTPVTPYTPERYTKSWIIGRLIENGFEGSQSHMIFTRRDDVYLTMVIFNHKTMHVGVYNDSSDDPDENSGEPGLLFQVEIETLKVVSTFDDRPFDDETVVMVHKMVFDKDGS